MKSIDIFGLGLDPFIIFLIAVISFCISLYIFYLIIKVAVRDGVIAANNLQKPKEVISPEKKHLKALYDSDQINLEEYKKRIESLNNKEDLERNINT